MRRTTLVPLVLAACVGVSACSGGDDPEPQPSISASAGETSAPTDRGEDTGTDEGVRGTFADVSEPATVPLPAKGLEGLDAYEDIRVWEGSKFIVSDEQVTAGIVLDDGSEVVVVIQSDQVLADESSRAEMDYWLEYTTLAERPREIEPVVVDGVEMLRAQGDDNGIAFVDHFVRGTGELTATLDFLLPLDLSRAEREEYVGQVMATVRLDPELL